MATPKIKENDADVMAFINAISDEAKRADCLSLLKLLEKITRQPAKMWGAQMIGFGQYHYVYESGRAGDWFLTGFSPRKQNLSIYMMSGLEEDNPLLSNLGKYKMGKSCLYTKKLADLDLKILEQMIRASIKATKARWK